MDYRQQMFPQMSMQPGQQYGQFPTSMQQPGGQMSSTGASFPGGGQGQFSRRLDRLERQVDRMNRRITQIERQMQFWGQMGHH
ncbi:hypothetical protein [Bacillus sp. FJAT-49736]|uniref:hypothetical protein n=1 Tax=Bacillus sp. FJAT-49736 TaxID=2833582 RepID=UPI001BC8E4C9|nr:hypothetical protein [Bacillus sp. FJAT-49736]MBS4173872.1 hypothetical protein [Bacillus sp. FJAT-49736]